MKGFHEFAPDFILNNSPEVTDLKRFWTMKFKKAVDEVKVEVQNIHDVLFSLLIEYKAVYQGSAKLGSYSAAT